MPEGFYVTDKGIELINTAVKEEKKVEINKAQFGDGGDLNGAREYGITELKSKQYEKNFDPLTDTYSVSPTDPKALLIKVVIPAEVSCTINEIGFFDTENNLIVYGNVRERQKEAGIKFQYENWVKFDNVDESAVEIKIVSPEFEKVETLVESTKQEFDQKLQETTTSLTGILETAENDFNLDNYVSHEEYQELRDMVEASNSIMEEYVG